MLTLAVPPPSLSIERALILAPRGRDAAVARDILQDAGIDSKICCDLATLLSQLHIGADAAVVTEEALRADTRAVMHWVSAQPPWSDFPFIVLTEHGGGIERNPQAAQLTATLGNVSFLERPFHPTTLVSVVQNNLRGRRRQYECKRLNEELESRVHERTAELASANRQLLAQIEERERMEMTLRQMQRLEAVGQLTSGVAHDFNNLLTVVLGNISFLERQFAEHGIDGKMSQRLGYMRAAAERGAKLTDHLLSFSRRQRLEPKVLDLSGSVSGMRDLLQSTLGGTVHIETRLAPHLWPALVDPTQLELAVLNLAINARDAIGGDGIIEVCTANVTLGYPDAPEEPSAGEYVEICVRDNGSGMSPEVRAKVFEPFFTTKEIGKGSGLGLSQVLGFAKQSGGGVCINSRPGEGTSVHIFLPRAQSAAVAGEAAPRPAVTTDATGARILLVDDDNAVRDVTAALLRDLGYQVKGAGSGAKALELLKDSASGFDLIVIDFAMPGMNGAELARQVRKMHPALPVLFVTGFAERTALAGEPDAHIISKPFITAELSEKVRRALAGRKP
jgi:signal transduction histidine kinase